MKLDSILFYIVRIEIKVNEKREYQKDDQICTMKNITRLFSNSWKCLLIASLPPKNLITF